MQISSRCVWGHVGGVKGDQGAQGGLCLQNICMRVVEEETICRFQNTSDVKCQFQSKNAAKIIHQHLRDCNVHCPHRNPDSKLKQLSNTCGPYQTAKRSEE